MDINTRIQTAQQNLQRAQHAEVQAKTQYAEAEKRRDEVVAQILAEEADNENIRILKEAKDAGGLSDDEFVQRLQEASNQRVVGLEVKIESDLQRVESLIPKV